MKRRDFTWNFYKNIWFTSFFCTVEVEQTLSLTNIVTFSLPAITLYHLPLFVQTCEATYNCLLYFVADLNTKVRKPDWLKPSRFLYHSITNLSNYWLYIYRELFTSLQNVKILSNWSQVYQAQRLILHRRGFIQASRFFFARDWNVFRRNSVR